MNNYKARRYLLLSFITFLIVIASVLPSQAKESGKHHSSRQLVNFGSGESYLHSMKVNPSEYIKIKDISKDASDIPKPIRRKKASKIAIKLKATEVISDIAPGISYHYWTFNNTVPGPFLRVRVGDTVELELHNDKTSSHSHSIDLHAVTGSGGGAAVTHVEPGETKTLLFKTTAAGLFVYHCAAKCRYIRS